jgi:hypothetical protein
MGQQVETGVLPALFAGRVGEFAERRSKRRTAT